MYTLISGSPKPVLSNSLYFLNKIKNKLDNYKIYELKKDDYEEIIYSIEKSDVIVLAFPLYVDSPTSITLKFLDYIIDKDIDLQQKKIYVIVNCGFREGEHNITAIDIIKRWCVKTNSIYSGSILIGAGEIVGKKKYGYISKEALRKLKRFSEYISKKEICKDIITTMDYLNNKLYCYLANISWTKKGKNNNLDKKNLKIK